MIKIDKEKIQQNLPSIDVICLNKVDSTNTYAKNIKVMDKPCLVIAEEQTNGRGRFGRSFFSPKEKGLYLSFAFTTSTHFENASLATVMAAVALSRAIDKVSGVKTKIKWVNDIYLNNKKVAGILTEGDIDIETGNISKFVIGVGVNCFETEFPDELKDTATYIENPTKEFTREELAINFISELHLMLLSKEASNIVLEYKNRSMILGKNILIFNPYMAKEIGRDVSRLKNGIRARAIDISKDGGLMVELLEGRHTNELQTIHSGEVSIREEY